MNSGCWGGEIEMISNERENTAKLTPVTPVVALRMKHHSLSRREHDDG